MSSKIERFRFKFSASCSGRFNIEDYLIQLGFTNAVNLQNQTTKSVSVE